MAKAGFQSVDEYIEAQPEGVRKTLQRVRGIIRKAVPGAEEGISYQIPAYKIPGGTVIFFAGWKQHFSLYPIGEAMGQAFKDELARYKLSKGTLRFPLSEPVPVKLIERIARFRANETAARVTAKKATTKKATAKKATAKKTTAKKTTAKKATAKKR